MNSLFSCLGNDENQTSVLESPEDSTWSQENTESGIIDSAIVHIVYVIILDR